MGSAEHYRIKKVDDNAIAISTVANFKKSFQTERNEDYLPKPLLEADISPLLQSFADEVKAYLQESDSGITKDELLHSIQEIIIKYPALKDSDHKSEVGEFIFNESNAKYPNLFQLNDLEQLLNFEKKKNYPRT